MKESSTYQAILREGRQEGMLNGSKETLLNLLKKRFGNCPPEIENRIQKTNDLNQLQQAIMQAIEIKSPNDLKL